MAIDERYLTLLASLPSHGALFSEKKTPLSRISLNQRLKQLQNDDQKTLREIESLFNWDQLPLISYSEDLVKAYKKLMPKLAPDLRSLLEDKINLRSVIAALRYRHYQQSEANSPQALTGNWTISRFKSRIENHWADPTFSLQASYPWILEANELMKQEKILKLEELILKSAWEIIQRHQDHQGFSFKSVVIYVLKWNIVDRWTRYDSSIAQQRYLHLIQDNKPDLSGVMI